MTDGEGVSSVIGRSIFLLLLPPLLLRSAMTTAFPAIPAPSIILIRRLVTIYVRYLALTTHPRSSAFHVYTHLASITFATNC